MHRAQPPQNMLSTRIMNWCVPWAYMSGTDAYPEHKGQELMHTLSIFISFTYAQHKRKKNWCVHWAYASGTDEHAQHVHQKLKLCLAAPKIKVTSVSLPCLGAVLNKRHGCSKREWTNSDTSHAWWSAWRDSTRFSHRTNQYSLEINDHMWRE